MPLKVEEVNEWNEIYINRGTTGWFTGDGQMSIPLTGNDSIGAVSLTKTFWMNSDSRICTAIDQKSQRVTLGKMFSNHTAAIMNKVPLGTHPNFEDMDWHWGVKGDKGRGNLFDDIYYWALDGYADGDFVYQFMLEKSKIVINGFKHVGIDLVKIPIVKDAIGNPVTVDFTNYEIINTPHFYVVSNSGKHTMVSMASGIMENTIHGGAHTPDGYIYNYGLRSLRSVGIHRAMVVARVPKATSDDFSTYQYYNKKKGWTNNFMDLNSPDAELTDGLGGIYSVTPIHTGVYAGKYMLVTCYRQAMPCVAYRIGDSPVGPWSDMHIAYGMTKEQNAYRIDKVNFYNAKAHPHLSNPGELMISYSANRKVTWKGNIGVDKNTIKFIKLKLNELADKAPVYGVSLGYNQGVSSSSRLSSDTKGSKAFTSLNNEDSNKWTSENIPGDKWLKIDLQRRFYINRWEVLHDEMIFDPSAPAPVGYESTFVLGHKMGNPLQNTRDFRLEKSNDGISWTMVDQVVGNEEAITDRDIPETEGRYWRLIVTNPAQPGAPYPNQANIVNLNLYGRVLSTGVSIDTNNIALNKTITSGGGNDKNLLIDGSPNTQWLSSDSKDKQWFYVDLGSEKDIYKWVLRSGGVETHPTLKDITKYEPAQVVGGFDVSFSNDMLNWYTVKRVSYNIRNKYSQEIEPIRARYVKIDITTPSRTTDTTARIGEIEVYSGSGSQVRLISDLLKVTEIPDGDEIGFLVYPNPTENDNTSIRLNSNKNQKAIVSIVTPKGNTVFYNSVNLLFGKNEFPLNLSQLKPGVYFVIVDFSNKHFVQKIVH
jgi:hypothetical protein